MNTFSVPRVFSSRSISWSVLAVAHRRCSITTLAVGRTFYISFWMCLAKVIGLLDLAYWGNYERRSTAWTCSTCHGAVRAVVQVNDAAVVCHIWSSSKQLLSIQQWTQKWLMLMRLAKGHCSRVHIIEDNKENFLDHRDGSVVYIREVLTFYSLLKLATT